MKQIYLKKIIFMLLMIISIISIYGCGGSKSAESEKTITLAYDTDQDGTPDVFDDYPDNADKSDHPVSDEADHLTTHDSMETAIGKETPFYAPTTFKGSIDFENSQDYFAVSLEAGKTYSLVFYDPQKMDGRAVTFVPDVSVYTGNVNYRTEMSDPVDDELIYDLIRVIDEYEELSLEFSLAGESRIIIFSFTPQESRIHYIAIKSAQVVEEEASHQYRFDLIEDHDKDGMRIQFKAADNDNYIYNYEDTLLLKSLMIPYINEWESDGSPMIFSDEAETEFAETVNYLAAARAEPECNPRTSLNPFVSVIPWDDSLLFGYGIDASTGLPAERLQAVTSFTPVPADKTSTSTKTFFKFINSDKEYEKEVQVGANASFSAFGATVKASSKYLNNIKYSEKETTLILKYFVKETAPRLLDLADYTLTEDAKTYLSQNTDAFRNRYGDYFIAGATYGAQYIATLHIKATSSEKIKEIETKLQVSSSVASASAAAEFKQKFREATKGSEVTVNRTTFGGDDTKLSTERTPDEMFDDLHIFIQSVTEDNRKELEAYMLRFNQIPDGYSIASEINVNSCVFSKTRELTNNYLALSRRANVIEDLDKSTFQAGVQDDYAEEYDSLINEINDNRRAIFQDINKIEDYGTEVKATLDKFSDLIDRHSFFMKLVQSQSKWVYHTEHKAREGGFKSYPLSRAVNNDINDYEYEASVYASPYLIGYNTWSPEWKIPGDNSIFCYIKININKTTSGIKTIHPWDVTI
jgi:hypothetical protein